MYEKIRVVAAFVALLLLLFVMGSGPHEPYWLLLCSLIYAYAAYEWGRLARIWANNERLIYAGVLGCLFLFFCFFTEWSNGAILIVTWPAMLWLLVIPFWLRRKKTLRNWVKIFVVVIILLLLLIGILMIVGSGLAAMYPMGPH
jgi:CDP-diglyceride synthetase